MTTWVSRKKTRDEKTTYNEGREIVKEFELKERNINITVISETKKKSRGIKDLGRFTMVYCGGELSKQWGRNVDG